MTELIADPVFNQLFPGSETLSDLTFKIEIGMQMKSHSELQPWFERSDFCGFSSDHRRFKLQGANDA